jgi:soluble cytochrome b562
MKSTKTVAWSLAALSAFMLGGELYLFNRCDTLSAENAELKDTVTAMDAKILDVQKESDKSSDYAYRVKQENEDLKTTITYLDDQIDDLTISLSKANNTIVELSAILKAVEESAPKKTIDIDPENITEISGMTGDQFDEVIDKIMASRGLSTCKLQGTGETFEKVEDDYGINGLYILAIFSLESAFATRCINTNNFGGIRGGKSWKSFSSPSDCIYYEGRLLKEKYVDDGLVEIDDIGARYCESGTWPDVIQGFVDDYLVYMQEVVD